MVSSTGFIPDRGDLIWIDFNPQKGIEQAGFRPALVLSRLAYNKFGLCLLCPITSKIKGYPFEVVLSDASVIQGAVLCDQIRSVDWRERRVKKAGELNSDLLDKVTYFSSGLVQGK